MTAVRPMALVADDEPLLRQALVRQLASTWPELQVVAEARNGRETVERFEALRPDVCFLDVHMPGLSGVEAARRIGGRAHLVFVTAFDRYAVEAFAQGALDYLVKPVEAPRLADTVARLKVRLSQAGPTPDLQPLLQELAARSGRVRPRCAGSRPRSAAGSALLPQTTSTSCRPTPSTPWWCAAPRMEARPRRSCARR